MGSGDGTMEDRDDGSRETADYVRQYVSIRLY